MAITEKHTSLDGYFARDEDGSLWFYADKPYKRDRDWRSDWGEAFSKEIDKSLCPEVRWEDEEATPGTIHTKTEITITINDKRIR